VLVPEGLPVDPGQVTDACQLAEDLRAVRSTWDGATRDGGPAGGLDVTEKAYTAMRDTWFAEIGVHIALLVQACEAHRASARGDGDQHGATRQGGDARVR
jgi:hypothetical protein